MKEMIFASELSDKKVVDTSGSEIGELDHLRVEATTGNLTNLMVKPVPNLNLSEFNASGNLIVVPFAAVKAVKDVIVVDGEQLKVLRVSHVAVEEEEKSRELETAKAKAKIEPPKVGRVKARAATQENRSEADDERTQRRVSRVKGRSVTAETSSELEEQVDQQKVSRIKERSTIAEEKRGDQGDERAQRRLIGSRELPAFNHPAFQHPAFRRPASAERREPGAKIIEPPKGEQR
jgi:sporulation protein YlmC with PRC-barrel domain